MISQVLLYTMIEPLNHSMFLVINATPASATWKISLAILIARYLILIVPLLSTVAWLWSSGKQLLVLRQLLVKTALATVIALCLSWLIGIGFPHDRPFVTGMGYQFLPHTADNSYPSDHGTVIFTFALAFLLWHQRWSGLILCAAGCAIAWARIYLGVHWPADMFGAAVLGFVSCLISQLLWLRWGNTVFAVVVRLYRFCFAWPIHKGWVRR